MKKNPLFWAVVASILFLLLSVAASLAFNEGRLGFLGISTFRLNRDLTPFCFFVFFGFFGFFFEGKLSNTLMDERFQEHARRTRADTYKAGFVLLWIVIFLVGHGPLFGSLEYTAAILTSVVSFSLGLVVFLNEYLLYRYNHVAEEDCDG